MHWNRLIRIQTDVCRLEKNDFPWSILPFHARLLRRLEKTGADEPLSKEKMAPVMAAYAYDTWEEAVEIAKKYETPETVKFINGILGSFLREEIKE